MHAGTAARTPSGTIEVSVRIGATVQPLWKRADGMLFVAGSPGQAYTLHVRNLTGSRAEVINTVDGRHTLRDEPGDTSANRGLVFQANSSGEFTGWRLNDNETRQFVFGAPDRSVAAQATGSTTNVGVIGFAAYRERVSDWHAPGYRGAAPVATADAAPGGACLDSSVALRSLGTGMGERQEDRVHRTSFTRALGEPDILVIGYDTEDVLREMGIMGPPEPAAFPGMGTGYEQYQP